MDILKSEILRKRQLVEDRKLLVVRLLWSRGVGPRGVACWAVMPTGFGDGWVRSSAGAGRGAVTHPDASLAREP